jgi:hypothetical protein
VGVADRVDPESPAAAEWGAVDHSVLWTGEPGVARVLPSPYALAHGTTEWMEWYGNVAHAVNTELDQVGSGSHVGWDADGGLVYAPTVYLNASRCGVAVPTTHRAFWEGGSSDEDAADATMQRLHGGDGLQPEPYRHELIRERVSGPRE